MQTFGWTNKEYYGILYLNYAISESTACKLPVKFEIWTSFVIDWIKVGVSFISPFIGSNFMGSLHAVLNAILFIYYLLNFFAHKFLLQVLEVM